MAELFSLLTALLNFGGRIVSYLEKGLGSRPTAPRHSGRHPLHGEPLFDHDLFGQKEPGTVPSRPKRRRKPPHHGPRAHILVALLLALMILLLFGAKEADDIVSTWITLGLFGVALIAFVIIVVEANRR